MTNNSGTIQAEYSFDPYGRTTKISEITPADFQQAGSYLHARSTLSITLFRDYAPQIARWISRDPIDEAGGTNLYAYVENRPITETDPFGLSGEKCCLTFKKEAASTYIIQTPVFSRRHQLSAEV